MKIIVLADLHGNMVATEAIEREIEKIKPDDIWFLGDAVGKGPESDKTIDWVRAHCNHWIAGNWDRVLSQIPEKNLFYIEQIGQERLDWLNSLPLEDELTISGMRFRLVHGRFLDPLYIGDDPDEKLRAGFRFHDGRPEANGLICADTHTPFIRPLDDGYAINTGSVGNNLGVPRAHALLLEGEEGPGTLRFTILSVPYDNKKAAEIADRYPDLPKKEGYQREVTMGIYSR
ncbi:MAG: metallophosphoesterase family protein [Lachnospiraceae bacterium]|nr:metallophosphoesterase family protein [Lachnospiraceae bacterium]